MHAAVAVLQKCLPIAFQRMHAVRARALLGAVGALIAGRRLILMDLARAWPGAERVRAPLKRIDRLLGNVHLHTEIEGLYRAMASWLLRGAHPVIIVDWSDLQSDTRWVLLRAGVPVGARTLSILERIYPQSLKGSPKAQQQFLRQLHALVARDITPIIVTDAGFRSPWFRAVAKLGWHYVGRVRSRTRIRLNASTHWFDNRQLYERATAQPRRFIDVQVLPDTPWQCDLVLYCRPAKGRYCLTRHGTRSYGRRSVAAQKREKDPWLLMVSPGLRGLTSARQIVALYAQRMQIEQSFRDLKCDRFGCAFRYSLTRRAERLAVLLLIHALATFLAWLSALCVCVRSVVSYGGILSARPTRHYSLLRIGWEALRRRDPQYTPQRLRAAYFKPPAWFIANLAIPS